MSADQKLHRRDAEPCPVTRAGCVYGSDCAGLGYCKRRVARPCVAGCFRQREGGAAVWYVVPSCKVHGGRP